MDQLEHDRSAILEAGIAEISEHGLDGASMASIATRATVPQDAVDAYLPNKQALLDEVVGWMVESVSPMAQLRYDPARPFAQQLRELAELEMELIFDPKKIPLSRIVQGEAMRAPGRGMELLMRFADKEGSIQRWFVDAAADGQLGDLAPNVAADTFTGMLKTPHYWVSIILWAPPPDAAVQREVIDRACEFLLCRLQKQPA
ncbi:TetR/AcrR family transcriptional regulator C-terminal domain-containing protein [Lysobacter enzymogenes]|uniref:TetR/AcrR family transcriptional regulator C-terminal domain-containing protein n=1 Tax=Lysobacter enzymogenes TaxID=69 RepID=UPI00384BBA6D